MEEVETIDEEVYIYSYDGVDAFIENYQRLRRDHPEYSDFRIQAREGYYDGSPESYLSYRRPLTEYEILENKKRMEEHNRAEIEKARRLLRENGLL